MTMSDERLEELRKMHQEATGTPWEYDETEHYVRIHGTVGVIPGSAGGLFGPQYAKLQILKARKHDEEYAPYWPYPQDLKMIIEGRNAFGELLEEIDRLKGELEQAPAKERKRCAQKLDEARLAFDRPDPDEGTEWGSGWDAGYDSATRLVEELTDEE